MHYYTLSYSYWRGMQMRRRPPLRRTWREVAVFAAECAVVLAVELSLLALGAMLDM